MREGTNGIRRNAEARENWHERRNKELEAALIAERAAREKAEEDELTNLPVRRSFRRSAEALFAPARFEGAAAVGNYFPELAFLFIDVDHFKKVNDTYGHAKADEVLRTIAHTLRGGIRPSDLIARWGGEEIVVLLPGATEEDAAGRAEELRKSVERLTFVAGTGSAFRVSASFGVASVENDGRAKLDELALRADAALYAAKHAGRNRVVRYSARTGTDTDAPEQLAFDYGNAEPREPEQGEFDFGKSS